MAGRVTIDDVAEAAGVSPKTVSRVINNEPNVREETQLRVRAAIEKLNFRPDPSARSLAASRSYLIGVVYDNPSDSYLMEIISGVLDTCQAQHYQTLLCPLRFDRADLVREVDSLIAQSRPGGLVLTPPLTDNDELLAHLHAQGVPFACISPKRAEGCGVTFDEQQAARDITAHLIALGHRRIAHVRGHAAHGASIWRIDGYREALLEAGLEFDPALLVQGEFSFDSGMQAARILLDLEDAPTAIFAANDDMAAGVVRVALERGLSVPGELSVCGFDDIPIARQIFPALTTVHQPAREMGATAAAELLKCMRDPAQATMRRVPYSLCLRASTGPAPKVRRAVRRVQQQAT
ncbi:MAG: LacI family DNA-binding transcriptional regulator [Xanthomonadales bacterium]|nr:LacI family DNA-binding transcriptional regulator [Xanthomonadales bacterium]